MGEKYSNLKNFLTLITILLVPFAITYIIVFPFYNISYYINIGELLVGIYSLTHMEQFYYGWGPYLLLYFQEVADYYLLLLGWSMKEAAILDNLWMVIPLFLGACAFSWCCLLQGIKKLFGREGSSSIISFI
ncbi:MAG: hypothetical protein ACETWM_08595 [Candidatus Lokiarchaeia archaeon]